MICLSRFTVALALAFAIATTASAEYSLSRNVGSRLSNAIPFAKRGAKNAAAAPWIADNWAPVKEADEIDNEVADDDAFIPFVARQMDPSPSMTSSTTPSASSTPTASVSVTPSASPTISNTPIASTTQTSTATATPSASSSAGSSPSNTPSNTPTPSRTPSPSSESRVNPGNPGNMFPVDGGNGVLRDIRCLKKPRRKVREFTPRKATGLSFNLLKVVVRINNFSGRTVQTELRVNGPRRFARVQTAFFITSPENLRLRNKRQLGDIVRFPKGNSGNQMYKKDYNLMEFTPPSDAANICGYRATLGIFTKVCDNKPVRRRICRSKLFKHEVRIPCIAPCRGRPDGTVVFADRPFTCPACR